MTPDEPLKQVEEVVLRAGWRIRFLERPLRHELLPSDHNSLHHCHLNVRFCHLDFTMSGDVKTQLTS